VKLNHDFTMAVETIQFLKGCKRAEYIQAGEIAKALNFSVGYLQKIIQTLSKHGIVECKRGRIGGVRMRAKKVTLLDIWRVTCGEIDLTEPPVPLMKRPMKAFADAMNKVVVYKRR